MDRYFHLFNIEFNSQNMYGFYDNFIFLPLFLPPFFNFIFIIIMIIVVIF